MDNRKLCQTVFLLLGAACLLCACLQAKPLPTAVLESTGVVSTASPLPSQPEFTSTLTATTSPLPATITFTPLTPLPNPIPTQGKVLLVTNTSFHGVGSLTHALTAAGPGDTIQFDPAVFPPDSPARIMLRACLGALVQGNQTIDASQAGVILDGSQLGSKPCTGLTVASDYNTILGLWFENFSQGPSIGLYSGRDFRSEGSNKSIWSTSCRFNRIGGEQPGEGIQVRLGNTGIQIIGQNTTDNIIAGSYFGVSPQGKPGFGNQLGIEIHPEASRTTIGPGNTIAFNQGSGIEILGMERGGNTITRNSIHDNGNADHCIEDPYYYPLPPKILEFDLKIGYVKGNACPGCTVEVFSDASTESAFFEGTVVAGAKGEFEITKQAPFSGPHLTATATDPSGATSKFSNPTEGASFTIRPIQLGNDKPFSHFTPLPSRDLDYNRIGSTNFVNCENPRLDSDRWYFGNDNFYGFTFARIWTEWPDWEELLKTGEYSQDRIGTCELNTIRFLVSNGIKAYHNLVYWEPIFHPSSGYSRFRNQEEIQHFLEYTRNAVGQLRGVATWTSLLNEPNIAETSQRYVKVSDYIALARRVIPVIREVDPHTRIVLGETESFDGDPRNNAFAYLLSIATSDVAPQVDGIAWHFGDAMAPDYMNYDIYVEQIMEAARANGFQGEFFANEIGYQIKSSPPRPWKKLHADIARAKYETRTIIWHLMRGINVSMGSIAGISSPEIQVLFQRILNTLMDRAGPVEIDMRLDPDLPDIQWASFNLPDGDLLVAAWRDVKVVEEDPGVPADLILPGIKAEKALAVDPLFGFQQELIIEGTDDLVIPGLLVKDYPILIRLEDYSSSN